MNKRKIAICIVSITILSIILVLLFYFSLFLTTNKAEIEVPLIEIDSKISGKIIEVNFEDNSKVQSGEIIAQIDTSEYQATLDDLDKKLEKAKEEVETSSKSIEKISANIKKSGTDLDEEKSMLERANSDYVRYKNAYKDGSVTQKDLNNAIKNLEIARSQYNHAKENLTNANSKLKLLSSEKNAKNNEIKELLDKINEVKLSLSEATIISPVKGTAINKNIEIGKEVKSGDKLLSIASDDGYVVAYFDDNQIKKIRKSMPAKIKIDKNKTIEGKVEDIDGLKVKIKPAEDIADFIITPNHTIYVKIYLKV